MRSTPTERARGKVLVVDDEPTIGDVVSRYLQRGGYETTIAENGTRALGEAAADRPGVVVLDLMPPGIDGLGGMRRLRLQDRTPTAVILLTPRGGEADRVIGLRRGAGD